MPVTTDSGLRQDLARTTYDYERLTMTAVWTLSIEGIKARPETVAVIDVRELLAALPNECASIYAFIVEKSIAQRAIAGGTVTPG